MDLTMDRLELPGGGFVEFNDPEQLLGEQVDRLFDLVAVGAPASKVVQVSAELLIAKWNIPGLPNLPLPSEDPKWWGQVPWRTRFLISRHMMPVISGIISVLRGAAEPDDEVPGSPPPPASE